MYYLLQLVENDVKVGEEPYYDCVRGVYEKVITKEIVAIFSTEEKARAYLRKPGSLIHKFCKYEIQEIPTDPEE